MAIYLRSPKPCFQKVCISRVFCLYTAPDNVSNNRPFEGFHPPLFLKKFRTLDIYFNLLIYCNLLECFLIRRIVKHSSHCCQLNSL